MSSLSVNELYSNTISFNLSASIAEYILSLLLLSPRDSRILCMTELSFARNCGN